ncbi:MAG: hypothetical protein AABZ53_13275 [Planctomycetota bacterium]
MNQGTTLNRRGSWVKGCLITLAIFIVLLVAAGIYVSMHWRGWVAYGMQKAGTDMVAQSPLPQDQKDRITTRINTFTADFESGKISMQQFADVAKEVGEGPLMPLGMVWGVREKYVAKSGFSTEEKASAERSLQRLARGLAEKTIPWSTIDEISGPVATKQGKNNYKLKEKVSDEELRKLIKDATARADAAKVPDETFEVNVADEVDKAIDKALGVTPKQ